MGNHSLLQIFLTQGSNPGLLHYKQIPYHLSYQEAQGSQESREIQYQCFFSLKKKKLKCCLLDEYILNNYENGLKLKNNSKKK